MNLRCLSSIFAIGFLSIALSIQSVDASEFELKSGDRVVFLGDALVEQEQYFGWIETMLTTSFADQDVTYRNLGWSGDTPAGDSRFGLSLLQAGLEPADEGWKQLGKQLELTKPTVVVFGYGMASALEGGVAGVDSFTRNFERLIAKVKEVTPDVRFLFLSPVDHVTDPIRSHHVATYAKAVRLLAEKNESPYVDLMSTTAKFGQRRDPIHLNADGYFAAAIAIQEQLKLESEWATSKQTEALRDVILRKNVWWFHRSRPANMAYVFGFRKREQGQNADEIPRFDKLVEDEEDLIQELRKLEATDVKKEESRTKSIYARFKRQPTPEFTVGKDLEVTLWAENPQLNKPIQINFDPKGRLWVASSEAYPMIEVGQSAPDKILVLEDTDNDGKADKSTVFADGLLIPTGVEPGDGGCYVAQSTDLLFLHDVDGDGKADSKERILNGFGTEDTHHNLHTLRWGPDGRLYMNQSIYTRTDAETPNGVVRLKAGGGFRYNPATMRMEVYFRGLVNSWGHQFDAYGQSFLTDGAGFSGIAYTFPGAKFRPTPKERHLLDLISPGRYPKFCSKEIVYGDSYPQEWQGSIVTCDFRANRVTRFSLSEQGAGFVTKQEDDLLRTAATTFRPIDVKQGPDGALYIADWSNPIINHGEVDFRDERRDRWHGRIWRLSWKKAKPKKRVDLTTLSIDRLMDLLKSDDRYDRDQARRVLIERISVKAPPITRWLDEQTDDFAKLQGVWLAQATDVLEKTHTWDLLESDNPNIRAAVMRVVSDWGDPDTDRSHALSSRAALNVLRGGVYDSHPRVRLEAVRGLAKLGTSEAARAALEVLKKPRDRFIDYALTITMDELSEPFMAALNAGQWQPDTPDREKQLEFALTSIKPQFASQYLSEWLGENEMAKDGSGPWIDLIGKSGGPAELKKLLEQATGGGFSSEATIKALSSLAQAQRLRRSRPDGGLNSIMKLRDSDDVATQTAAVKLIGAWKMGSQVEPLSELAETGKGGVRGAAIEALREIGKPAVDSLAKLAKSKDIGVRRHATMAFSSVAPVRAVGPFFKTIGESRTEKEALPLWRGFLNIRNGGKILADRFPKDGVSEVVARAGLQAAKEGGRNVPALVAALKPLANLATAAPEFTAERSAMLIKKVESEGDAARGEQVYHRKELACINCHAIGGVGGEVGPDMTSLGASAPIDYLVESIYKPNAKIKENYHSVIVATEDGQTVTGIVVESTDDELVLRDVNNKIVRVPQDDIVAKKNGQSLMPRGVVDRLSEAEQVDLIKFLTQLGKPGDYDASKGGVARIYEIFAGHHRIEQEGADRIINGEIKNGWKPHWSRVNGDVRGEVVKELTKQPINTALVNVYFRTEIEASADGEATFNVAGPEKAAMWIDGEPVKGELEFKPELKAGKHTVLVRIDGKAIPENFRLSSRDVTFAKQ